jgi:DNA repair protein RecN (Recombination protein N)
MSKAVENELNDLSLAGAKICRVNSTSLSRERVWKSSQEEKMPFQIPGLDQVEFMIAPNPGEGLENRWSRIASGGETSRLMLAFK